MSNVTRYDSAIDDYNDGFAQTAEGGGRNIRGTLIKFADWRWLAGQGSEVISESREFAITAAAMGWVRWSGGKPDRYVMRMPRQRMPEREEMGDLDDGRWELDSNREPRDPWQDTRFVYLTDVRTAEAFTYTTSSSGGVGAVADVSDQIMRMRTSVPGVVPIVTLGAAAMKTKFGMKSRPVFKVVRWSEPDDHRPAVQQAPPQRAIPRDPSSRAAAADMNDEIPF